MKTCGARPGGPSLDGVDLTKQTVIQGIILRDGIDDSVPNGAAVANGHVRLPNQGLNTFLVSLYSELKFNNEPSIQLDSSSISSNRTSPAP